MQGLVGSGRIGCGESSFYWHLAKEDFVLGKKHAERNCGSDGNDSVMLVLLSYSCRVNLGFCHSQRGLGFRQPRGSLLFWAEGETGIAKGMGSNAIAVCTPHGHLDLGKVGMALQEPTGEFPLLSMETSCL